jgi:hypothetical protein
MHFQNNTFSFTYLIVQLVSPLNNPQNNEMKICEKIEVDVSKIVRIIIDYTPNNFTAHITIL